MDTMNVGAGLTVDDLPEDSGPRHELVDGSLFVTPMGDLQHQFVIGRLHSILTSLAPSELAVLITPNIIASQSTLLIPDLAVASAATVLEGARTRRLGLAPTDVAMVVEVLSPSTARYDRSLKRQTYLEWGIPTYWLVEAGRIERYGAASDPSWASLDEATLFGL